MSCPQDPHRPHFPFKNPFSMILPKGSSHLSPKLLSLLNAFEESLAEKLKCLKPGCGARAFSLSWMKEVMASLSTIHTSVRVLVKELELPVCGWDEKWIDVYMENSVSLLDICTAFSSEISRINQSNLYLRSTVQTLEGEPKQFARAQSLLEGWRRRLDSGNPRLENCFVTVDRLVESLKFPKKKDSGKERVLMRALYGVRVVTIFLCSVVAVAFSGSSGNMKKGFEVLEGCLWAEAFVDLQSSVTDEIRDNGGVTRLKELEAVDASVKKLYPIVEPGVDLDAVGGGFSLQNATSELRKNADVLSEGLDLLAKEVDGFFHVILTGRNAMLSNIRVGSNNVSKSMQDRKSSGGVNSVNNKY